MASVVISTVSASSTADIGAWSYDTILNSTLPVDITIAQQHTPTGLRGGVVMPRLLLRLDDPHVTRLYYF